MLNRGWSLREAAERAARKQWEVYQSKLSAANAAGPKPTIRGYAAGTPGELAAQRARPIRRLYDAAEAAQREVYYCLRELLSAGQLTAFGRPGDLSAKPIPIEPDQWASLSEFDFGDSLVADGARKTQVLFSAVQVFPVLKSPDAARLLSHLRFDEVFKRFVIDDPEVRSLAELAIASQPESEGLFHEGMHSPVSGEFWPVHYEKLDLPKASHFECDCTPPEEVKLAAEKTA
jgi:hypothetical protein